MIGKPKRIQSKISSKLISAPPFPTTPRSHLPRGKFHARSNSNPLLFPTPRLVRLIFSLLPSYFPISPGTCSNGQHVYRSSVWKRIVGCNKASIKPVSPRFKWKRYYALRMRRPYPFPKKGRGRPRSTSSLCQGVPIDSFVGGAFTTNVECRRSHPLLPGYRGAAATPTLGRNVTSVTRHDDCRPRLSGEKEGERERGEISRKIPDAILCQDDARPIRETEVEIALEIEPDHSERV